MVIKTGQEDTKPVSSTSTVHSQQFVLLVLNFLNEKKQEEQIWQEFALPLEMYRVQEWCELRDIWFHKVITFSETHELSFHQRKHKINDLERMNHMQLEDGCCYLVCGFAEGEHEKIQEIEETPALLALPAPSSVFTATIQEVSSVDSFADENVEKTLPEQFRIITRLGAEESSFYLESCGMDLESALKMYVECNASTYSTYVQRRELSSLHLSSTEYIADTMASSNLSFQLLSGIQRQDGEKVKILLNLAFIEATVRDSADLHAVHHAAIQGNLNVMNLLLKSPKTKQLATVKESQYGYSPLHYAAAFGNGRVITALLDAGAEVDDTDLNNYTPLYYAAIRGQAESIKVMIEYAKKHNLKLNVNVCDPSRKLTALHTLAKTGPIECLQELLSYEGVQYNLKTIPEGDTPLHFAARGGNLDVVKLLIEKAGPQATSFINERGTKKATPITVAAKENHIHIVKYLAEKGANIDIQDEDGNSPLLYAVIRENFDLLNFVISKKASLDVKGLAHCGITPLQLACSKGTATIVEILTAAHPDPNYSSEFTLANEGISFTPLINATIEGFENCVAAMLKYVPKVQINKATGMEKRTALHFACTRASKRVEIIKMLLKHGADVNARDAFGMTPAHIAKSLGADNVVQILAEHGADLTLKDYTGTSVLNYNEKAVKLPVAKYEQMSSLTRPEYLFKDNKDSLISELYGLYRSSEAHITKIPIFDSEECTALYEEMHKIASNLPKHPNFQKYLAVAPFFGFMYAIGENMHSNRRDLHSLISDQGSALLMHLKLHMALQIVYMLDLLHKHGLLYRNLQCASIRIMHHEAQFEVLFADIALTPVLNVFIEEKAQHLAPEVLQDGPTACTKQSDYYSLALVLYELFSGTPPQRSKDSWSITGNWPKYLHKLLASLNQFLQFDPAARPSSLQDLTDLLLETYLISLQQPIDVPLHNPYLVQLQEQLLSQLMPKPLLVLPTILKLEKAVQQSNCTDVFPVETYDDDVNPKALKVLQDCLTATQSLSTQEESTLSSLERYLALTDEERMNMTSHFDDLFIQGLVAINNKVAKQLHTASFAFADLMRMLVRKSSLVTLFKKQIDHILDSLLGACVIEMAKQDLASKDWRITYSTLMFVCNLLNDKEYTFSPNNIQLIVELATKKLNHTDARMKKVALSTLLHIVPYTKSEDPKVKLLSFWLSSLLKDLSNSKEALTKAAQTFIRLLRKGDENAKNSLKGIDLQRLDGIVDQDIVETLRGFTPAWEQSRKQYFEEKIQIAIAAAQPAGLRSPNRTPSPHNSM